MRGRSIHLAAAAVATSVVVVLAPTVANAADVWSSGTRTCASNRTAWVEGVSRGYTYHKPPGGTTRFKGFTSKWKQWWSYSNYGNGGGLWRIDAEDPNAGLTSVSAGCSAGTP